MRYMVAKLLLFGTVSDSLTNVGMEFLLCQSTQYTALLYFYPVTEFQQVVCCAHLTLRD